MKNRLYFATTTHGKFIVKGQNIQHVNDIVKRVLNTNLRYIRKANIFDATIREIQFINEKDNNHLTILSNKG